MPLTNQELKDYIYEAVQLYINDQIGRDGESTEFMIRLAKDTDTPILSKWNTDILGEKPTANILRSSYDLRDVKLKRRQDRRDTIINNIGELRYFLVDIERRVSALEGAPKTQSASYQYILSVILNNI